MGVWGDIAKGVGRGALAVGTGGISEAVGLAAGENPIDMIGSAAEGIGDAASGYTDLGRNNAQIQDFQYQDPTWGGQPGRADEFAGRGLNISDRLSGQAGEANYGANAAQNEMIGGYGRSMPTSLAGEDSGQVANEYASRGIQSNALGLAQQAAQGNAPSAAQYMMNSGLNTAMANQQAIAGGARGAAGLALAGGNMAGNNAAMQSQAFNQGGQLRAQEMATARDQYGNLATGQRGQDQSRIGQGNQMSQFNAGASNTTANQALDRDAQYRVGMGGVAGNLRGAATNAEVGATGALNTAMNPYNQTMTSGTTMQGLRGTSFDTGQQTRAGIQGGNADRKAGQVNKVIDFAAGLGSNTMKAK